MAVPRQQASLGKAKITDRYRNRNHSGKGQIHFTLMPSYYNVSSLRPPRRTWKIIRPLSRDQIIVPVYCHEAERKIKRTVQFSSVGPSASINPSQQTTSDDMLSSGKFLDMKCGCKNSTGLENTLICPESTFCIDGTDIQIPRNLMRKNIDFEKEYRDDRNHLTSVNDIVRPMHLDLLSTYHLSWPHICVTARETFSWLDSACTPQDILSSTSRGKSHIRSSTKIFPQDTRISNTYNSSVRNNSQTESKACQSLPYKSPVPCNCLIVLFVSCCTIEEEFLEVFQYPIETKNMPVSRNFSLPASIEGRKLKKRPETLNRCVSDIPDTSQRNKPSDLLLKKVNRPNFLSTLTNCNNINDVEADQTTTSTDKGNKQVADCTNVNDTVMGVDTTSTRGGTLSQPCLPISSTVGATRIFPHLYLGSQKDVVDEEMMRSNGITYVLNVSTKCMQPGFIDDNHFHRISVRDNYQEKMMPFMREAIEFIEKVRKSNQRVIVHCLAGVSRSATVAIAYVLHYLRISFEDAYRFVKEKRPSISPNFNFLGQLMEFERNLKSSGHMDTKRTGSFSDCCEEDRFKLKRDFKKEEVNDNATSRSKLCLNTLQNKTDSSPLYMPAACSFQCASPAAPLRLAVSCPKEATLRVNAPTSSFCRRRNAPTLSKDVFSSAFKKNTNKKTNCDTPMPKHLSNKSGLLMDLRVTVPQTPRVNDASRRLGSDGNEMDETTSCEAVATPISTVTFTPISDTDCKFSHHEDSMDCSYTNSTLKTKPTHDDDKFAKPRTAPNTPLIGRQRSGLWRQAQLAPPTNIHRHRRCASGGGVGDITLGPLPMKRRFDARTERSASFGDVTNNSPNDDSSMEVDSCSSVKRGSSFSTGSYYDHSEPSSRAPHKFVSVNSRSPKILRKSFNLNLRPVYSHSSTPPRGSSASEMAQAPRSTQGVLHIDTPALAFDCTHNMSTPTDEPLRFNVNKGNLKRFLLDDSNEQKSDDILVINSMSPLTLSSPSAEKDDSLLFPSTDAKSPMTPATCPVLGSSTTPTDPSFPCNFNSPPIRRDKPTRLVYKGSFTFSSQRQTNDTKTDRPFMLSAGCDLKLRWRSKDRRRQSADSGYLSSQASSQSSSSFTSPTSQQGVFGSCSSSHDSFADMAADNNTLTTNACTNCNSSCHAEGAYVNNADDVTNSNTDSEGRTSTPVSRVGAVEIMSCS